MGYSIFISRFFHISGDHLKDRSNEMQTKRANFKAVVSRYGPYLGWWCMGPIYPVHNLCALLPQIFHNPITTTTDIDETNSDGTYEEKNHLFYNVEV